MADISTVRKIWATTPLPPAAVAMERMEGYEALGQPFLYHVTLLSTDPALDLSGLLGNPMTVHVLTPPGFTRHFNGIITRASQLDDDGHHARYTVTVQPWLSLLAYHKDCRIFQDMSVPDVIEEVFRLAGFSDFEDTLDADAYPKLEYCVQYNESDLSFVSRLMERAGIYYYFKHEETKHTLVLCDSGSAHDVQVGYEEIPYRPEYAAERSDHERISSWVVAQQIRSGAFATTDFDFKAPRTALLSTLNTPQGYAHDDAEVFVYPGGYLTSAQGEVTVKRGVEERQHEYRLVQAAGDPRGVGAGHLFTLADYPRGDQNKQHLIVTASYAIHAGDFESGAAVLAQEEFRVSLTLLDSKTPFRPPLHTRRVRVEGPQTAMVVGPEGEEIWTDKYGRVMVQFHWDCYGASDERSSCWVRVSQAWAGPGWGAVHLPRMGQEVIVDFLEGDPDRPIVTGRVYNGDNMPPYTLPDNRTQSGIKSRSTPGGGPSNFNEIRFEDKKGSEELHIQAEKDQTTHVKHNQSISVDGDRSVTVGGNESIKVTGTRSSTITKKETQTFKDAREMTVTLTDTETVTGKHTGIYHGGRELTIEKGDTLTVQASNKTVTVHGQYDVTADTEFQVMQGANKLLIKDAVDVDSVGEIHLHNPKSSVDLKDGVLKITSATQIVLECGTASITLNKDGTIEINGSQKVTANGGGAGVELAAPGATMSGTKASISGTAMTEITGAIVKIN